MQHIDCSNTTTTTYCILLPRAEGIHLKTIEDIIKQRVQATALTNMATWDLSEEGFRTYLGRIGINKSSYNNIPPVGQAELFNTYNLFQSQQQQQANGKKHFRFWFVHMFIELYC